MKLTCAIVAAVSAAAIQPKSSACSNLGQESYADMPTESCAGSSSRSQPNFDQSDRISQMGPEYGQGNRIPQFRPTFGQTPNRQPVGSQNVIDPQQIIQNAHTLGLKLDKLQEFMDAAAQLQDNFKEEFGDLNQNIQEMRQNLQVVSSLHEKAGQMGGFKQGEIGNAATCAKSLSSKLAKLQQFLQTAVGLQDQFTQRFGNIQSNIQEIRMDLAQIEAIQNVGQQGRQQGQMYKRWVDLDVDLDRDFDGVGVVGAGVAVTPIVGDVGVPGPGIYGHRGWGGYPYRGVYGAGYRGWGGYPYGAAYRGWGGYGGYWGNSWASNRAATLSQCYALARAQTTGQMYDAYMATCAAYEQ